jgi:hypothetical protein
MATKELWTEYNGKGFSAEHAGYAERATFDEDGNDIVATYALKSELPSAMAGATSSAAGTSGLVPAPAAGAQDKVLRGDGTWGDAANATVSYNAETGELHLDFSPQANSGGNT